MAVWPKEDVTMRIVDDTTGEDDTSVHTVKLQPINQAYDAGAIACSQKTVELCIWGPDSDLDDEMHYHWYIDGTKKKLLPARESKPNV